MDNLDPTAMEGLDKDQLKNFDPEAVAGFDNEHMENFDPTAMEGFDKDQLKNFDPEAVAGFAKEHMENFDPTAMEGFDKDQVGNFDKEAVSGLKRDHITEMDDQSLSGFNEDQVRNFTPESKEGMGDAVQSFEDFDIGVRKELVEEDSRRLGGVGSFDDLVKSINGELDDSESLDTLGWDKSVDEAQVEFGSSENAEQLDLEDATEDRAKTAFSKLKLFD